LKKGCFLKSIIILTILVAAGLYIVQNHLDDIVKPGKKIIKDLVMSDIEDDFAYVKSGSEKDSLKNILENYLTEKIENADKISDKDIDWLIDSVKFVVRDSIITREDLNKIKNLIEQKGYEGSKEN